MFAIIQSKIFCLPISYQKNLKIKIHKTVILPVVLFGCEAWSLILREEHGLRVFENRVLRRRDEDGSWRKLRNDELHNLYSSPNIVRVIKSRSTSWAGDVARMGRGVVFTGFLLGGPKGRPRPRWEDNINMDLREIGIDVAKRTQLAQDRVQWQAFVSTAMNLRVP
jgi:hypothetical protein